MDACLDLLLRGGATGVVEWLGCESGDWTPGLDKLSVALELKVSWAGVAVLSLKSLSNWSYLEVKKH